MLSPAWKSSWKKARPWLAPVLLLLVAVIVYRAASKVDWHQVLQALRHMPPTRLLLGAAFAAASYACYSCVDLFAAPLIDGKVSRARSMCIAFVSYAFNQNFGSLLGTIGFRFRLYSHHGLGPAAIATVVGLSFLTNWCGYFVLAGIAFASGSLIPPHQWALGAIALRGIGVLLLAIAGGYFALCARSQRRSWEVFGTRLELPSLPIALAQLALSSAIWLNCAAVVFVLLPGHIEPLTVLTVLLLASIAGLITHVPGGVGVIESVFFALLGSRVAHHELLAGLLAYRVVYYFCPLLVAVPMFVWLESTATGNIQGRKESAPVPARGRTGETAPT
jgi:uncharacterized membrane protein YbhN (UPF0104 family)